MAHESLQELLARVRERLAQRSGALDPDSRQQLGALMRDLERLGTSTEDAAAVHASRLESLAVRFEAGHPALAEALRELMDALVKAGI